MNNALRFGLALAVVVVVGLIGYQLVADPSAGGPPVAPSPTANEDPATPSPTIRPTPVELAAAGEIAPGTYYIRNDCSGRCADYRRIIFTLPAGWATSDGLVYKHLGEAGEVAFSVWTPYKVYADPCQWEGSALSSLDLREHTHDSDGTIILLGDRTGGLANQADRNASELTQVMLGGQIALKIELSVPAHLDLAKCDAGEFRSWTEWGVPDSANSHHAPGQIDVVYMVDVDRLPFVVDASHMPGSSAEDIAELETILSSMDVDRGY